MNTPPDLVSPYQPPSVDQSAPVAELAALPPHERSGASKVFGVLSIIFSAIVLLGSAFGLLASAATGMASGMENMAPSNAEKAELNAMMHPLAKVYQGFGYQSMILFVMSAVLLAIGIGQLRYRRWARRWSVTWGAAGLVCVVAMVAISLLIISPAYAQLFDSAARLKQGTGIGSSMGPFSTMLGGIFAVLCVVVYAPYPAMMLLFFTRERVRASMTE